MNEDRITVREALRDGDLYTRLSAVIMGAGMLGHRQIVKGILVLLMEVAFWLFMVTTGFHNLAMLPSLGTEAQGKVWNEAKQIYEYSTGDNSQQILLAGVITCFVLAGIAVLWVIQMRHSFSLQRRIEEGDKVMLQDELGRPFDALVTALDGETITFDCNHEMAGKALNFTIEMLEIN